MIRYKSAEEIEVLREGGRRLAEIMVELRDMVVPGVTTDAIDTRAFDLSAERGDRPAFLHYQPAGSDRGFPGSVCVSINDEIVHGIPNEDPRVLREGDLVKLDFGLVHNGLVTDSATTVPVGLVNDEAHDLMQATTNVLEAGIQASEFNGTTDDIGAAVQTSVEDTPFHLAEGLAGHGVGYEVHEEPLVPNKATAGEGERLVPGFVYAIEPMLSVGTSRIAFKDDGFTICTADGSLSAHEEHTLAVTADGVEVLTRTT
jgi:methionyl aminopeptidase